MAKATFWQRGEALDYTNKTDAVIEANTIIIYGHRIGIAGCDIAPGETGSLHVTGVFALPKKDATAIEAGVNVYWNPDADAPGATASGGSSPADAYLKIGFAAQAAAADDTTILVKINA